MATYRLQSADMVHTPSIVAMAKMLVKTNAKIARHLITEGFPELPEKAVDNLLSGKYQTEGNNVIVSDTDETITATT